MGLSRETGPVTEPEILGHKGLQGLAHDCAIHRAASSVNCFIDQVDHVLAGGEVNLNGANHALPVLSFAEFKVVGIASGLIRFDVVTQSGDGFCFALLILFVNYEL